MPGDHDGDPAAMSVQERLYPDLRCFGCGHANERGLRLRSYEDADAVTGSFMPWPEHDNGAGFLNGGIIATLLDCHGAAAVLLEADRRGWRPLGDTALSFVTAGIEVRYLRPAPLGEPVDLWAALLSSSEDEMRVRAELRWGDKPRATAEATWRRFRPR